MACLWPNALCIGVDEVLEYVAPTDMSNVQFIQANLSSPFSSIPMDTGYDFIFHRLVLTTCTGFEWIPHLHGIYHSLVPGGRMEIQESSGAMARAGPILQQLQEDLSFLFPGKGGYLSPEVFRLQSLIESIGFHDVSRHIISIPVGTWGGEPGLSALHAYHGLLNQLRPSLVKKRRVDLADDSAWSEALTGLAQEVDIYQSYWNLVIYTAERPMED